MTSIKNEYFSKAEQILVNQLALQAVTTSAAICPLKTGRGSILRDSLISIQVNGVPKHRKPGERFSRTVAYAFSSQWVPSTPSATERVRNSIGTVGDFSSAVAQWLSNRLGPLAQDFAQFCSIILSRQPSFSIAQETRIFPKLVGGRGHLERQWRCYRKATVPAFCETEGNQHMMSSSWSQCVAEHTLFS